MILQSTSAGPATLIDAAIDAGAERIVIGVRTDFDEVTWQAFWLTTIDRISPSIAAERLGVSLASVYQARTRILRKLRQRLLELPD